MLPGGVNSPVRAFKSVGGSPIVIDSVSGSHVVDVDGNSYIDYVGTWGPAIVGHANTEVNQALKAQIDKGTSFGAPCELEVCNSQAVGVRLTSLVSIPKFSVTTMAWCQSVLEAGT